MTWGIAIAISNIWLASGLRDSGLYKLAMGLFWLALAIAMSLWGVADSHRSETTSAATTHPTGPMPDFDYRGGEWLEGFCAMVRIYEWQRGDDEWKKWSDNPLVGHYYDLRMGYPDRTVSINCKHMTIDIDREISGSESGAR